MRYVWVLHEYHAILLRNLTISGLWYPRGNLEERPCGYWGTSDPTNMWLVGLGLLPSLRGVDIYFSSGLACKSPEIRKNYFCFLDLCVTHPETYPFKNRVVYDNSVEPQCDTCSICYFCSLLMDLGTRESHPVLSNNSFCEGHFTS